MVYCIGKQYVDRITYFRQILKLLIKTPIQPTHTIILPIIFKKIS